MRLQVASDQLEVTEEVGARTIPGIPRWPASSIANPNASPTLTCQLPPAADMALALASAASCQKLPSAWSESAQQEGNTPSVQTDRIQLVE